MFTRLIESQRAREQGIGARIVSIAAHAAILAGAVYATVGAAPAPVEIVTVSTLGPYVPSRPHTGSTPSSGRSCNGLCPPRLPLPPITIPVTIDPSGPPIELPGEVFGTGGESGAPGPDLPADGIYEVVERPAAALPGNPRPAYPSILRSAHIEATVSARFIVDTTGHVEPASITFESSGERLFEESVRRALLASRYAAAEMQGRRVRMLVRQDFAFRIMP